METPEGIKVVSWNVLHIVHEYNYCNNNSPVLNKYRNREQVRLQTIVEKLADYRDNIICLQEVPEDLYELLKVTFCDSTIYQHKYPRIPSIRTPEPPEIYKDNQESLLVILPKGIKVQQYHSIQSTDDNGKGAQILHIKGIKGLEDNKLLALVNTHMPFNKIHRQRLLLDIYKNLKEQPSSHYLIIGDTNSIDEVLKGELSSITDDYKVHYNLLVTRKGMNEMQEIYYQRIDHAITSNSITGSVYVDDVDDLSDHSILKFFIS